MYSRATRSIAFAALLASCLPVVSAAVLSLPVWFRNSYALVEVQVGTPSESHLLRFDTGSSTTWIVDGICGSYGCTNYSGYPRNGYNISASSTGTSLGTYATIPYLGGSVGGPGVADVFSFPSAPEMEWNQTFMAAATSTWSVMPADGFLGLAFSTIADADTKTLVETLLQDGKLDSPRFGLYYGKELNDTGNTGGEGVLMLGGSEEDKYVDGELTWVEPLQLISGEYELWRSNMVSMTGKRGGNSTATPITFDGRWAVFDTGAGGITIPESQAIAVYESIGMNWTAIINHDHIPLCTEFTADWSVAFSFGDPQQPVTITLTGEQLARPGFADGSPQYCWPPFDTEDNEGLFLFGTPFLHQLYSVFDFGANDVASYRPRVGFGQLKEEFKP
ncbi:pepsinogen c [Thozetella sp. PMI_491]|nr:pepsinogen c [Thozetella sp. PMI_491]